ncbi:MAG TPA: glycosyltransferase family 39 protein [Solirubrobacteraceae bacterium]|jgi:4-amino-4-deoxy-L-arabinose transferase-like glycosyltransferase|nr:glycosyltransferase family 39 protein [Solirubrobacteraceae bacterium]
MSTPQITAPGRALSTQSLRSRAEARARQAIRGDESDPSWSRPLLWVVGLLAGVLGFWGLTRNGYANTYYSEAAQAASRSWTAWITNALDVSGSDSLDKGPLSNMVMGLSGRVFGFSSFSMLLPEALAGVGSVVVLHSLVKRTLGHRPAILAALMLALTPIFVAMTRFNNPDAILLLTEIGAAWALVRALESGRTRHLLLCGLLVGLAFNTKMLEAYLVVPGLVLTYLIAGPPKLGRRLAQLSAAGAAMFAVSFVWYGAMMLLPAADRPWVGDTTDNSWFSLIFGANGLSRVSGSTGGPGGGAGFGGSTGPLRLFNTIVGGQIAWLIPLAIAGLGLGLWTRRRAPRTDRARSAYILWGGWAVVSWAIFSFQAGIFHPYYTTLLAPAVAVLAAGGLVVAWDRARRSAVWSLALGLALTGTAVLGDVLLERAAGFVTWLGPVAIAVAAASGCALLISRLRPAAGRPQLRRRLAGFAMIAGLVGVLAGPTSYSLATVGRSITGSNPLAGPAGADSGIGGFGGGGGRPTGARGFGRPPGTANLPSGASRPTGAGFPGGGTPPTGGGAAGPGATSGGGPGGGGSVSTATVKYLEAHQAGAKYLVAAVGSQTAADLSLQTGQNVVDMGGFTGSDPTPSLAKLQGLIDSGQLHYVLLSSSGGGGPAGGRGGIGGGSNAATTARDAWIKANGKVVTISGQTGTTGASLYYFAG